MRTQVGIVGAGPAGLVLSHLLAGDGVESVVLEARSREHVEQRVRAGVLEQGTVELLRDSGLAARLDREGIVHRGIEIRFDGGRHRIALADLTGRSIWIYGQQELVKDLIAARLGSGGPIAFDVEDVRLEGIDSSSPSIRYRTGGVEQRLDCDWIAGCDGFHGVSRGAVPAGVLRELHYEFPFAWLGVLASVAPSAEELIYARHDRGFALHSLRSPEISRLYLQVDPDEDLAAWPDDRIWEELRVRLGTDDGWELADGPIVEKGIAAMRSFVVEPMQYGRLFLAGDSAHIVPATGAKGLNLAVADVRVLAMGLVAWYRRRSTEGLDGYTGRCLRRVWRVQDFSIWLSSMLHRYPDHDEFQRNVQRARLDWVTSSESAARSLAENYVGLPFDLETEVMRT
jgi:p-hydroxybenzoate 3-monooxygenase